MFQAGSEPGSASGGVISSVLVPTRFVWPHGGRRVFLVGSFTRWVETLPMSPVEGCPSVFQAICNLPPGYHQYKFIVGDCRHDEQQPVMTASFGTVNNILLVREPEVVCPATNSEPLGFRANMEVDHDVFHRVVVALDISLPVKQAFHVLYDQLGNHGAILSEEELESHTIAAWKDQKMFINRQEDGPVTPFRRPLIYVSPYDSLKEVAQRILQNEIATVPVIHSSAPDGSSPELLHLASLSGILKSNVSAIPIVDDNGSLLDIYARGDITALAKDRAYAQVQLDRMTIHQALQLGQDRNSPGGAFGGLRCHMCLRSDTLQKVIECLANPATVLKALSR